MSPLATLAGVVALAAAAALGHWIGSAQADGVASMALGVAVGLGAALAWLLTARPGQRIREATIWDALSREMDRSRRRSHRLALVRLGLSDDLRERERLRSGIRSMDRLEVIDGDAVLLLPEASRREAELLVGRLHETIPAAFRRTEARIAIFPDDGVTERALIAAIDGEPFFAEPLGKAALPDDDERQAYDGLARRGPDIRERAG